MKYLTLLVLAVLFCTTTGASGQHKFQPVPPPPSLDHDNIPRSEAPTTPLRRIDLGQLQKEADDLARTAQTIPSDVASVRRGTLPKDVLQKLKQIEKLSKHLRSELNQ